MSATFPWVLSSPNSSVALQLVAGAAEAASGNKRLEVELVKEFPLPLSSLNTHNSLSAITHIDSQGKAVSQRSTSVEGGKKGAEMGEAANLSNAGMGP